VVGTDGDKTKLTLAAAAVHFAAILPLSLLSYHEHVFNVAPSFIIEIYILFTIGFDAVRVRTLWLMPLDGYTPIAALETAAIAVKLAIAFVEAVKKNDLLLLDVVGKSYTKEQLNGLYGRSLFLWLFGLLWNGKGSLVYTLCDQAC